jgi:hypothetical protein
MPGWVADAVRVLSERADLLLSAPPTDARH